MPTRKAARRLCAINEAYEVLGSPHRRARYDREYLGYEASNGEATAPAVSCSSFVNMLGKPFRPD